MRSWKAVLELQALLCARHVPVLAEADMLLGRSFGIRAAAATVTTAASLKLAKCDHQARASSSSDRQSGTDSETSQHSNRWWRPPILSNDASTSNHASKEGQHTHWWKLPPLSGKKAHCQGQKPEDEKDHLLSGLLDHIIPEETAANWSLFATSLKGALTHMGPWSIGDLAFGLRALADKHTEDDVQDLIQGTPVTDRTLMQEMLDAAELAAGIYEPTPEAMCAICPLVPDNIIKFEPDASHFRPSYCIAVSPNHEEVLLVIRGTKTLSDALTNLAGSMEPFQGGHAHHGMLRSAQWLLEHELDTLADVVKAHPGYKLHLVGHSLGGGTASLLSILMHSDAEAMKRIHPGQVVCTAIATPPVVTHELAVGSCDHITTLVCGNDVIPRSSLASFEALRKEMLEINWEQALKDKVLSDRLIHLASATTAALDSPLGAAKKAINSVLDDDSIEERKQQATKAIETVVKEAASLKKTVLSRFEGSSDGAPEPGGGGGGGDKAETVKDLASGLRLAEGMESEGGAKLEDVPEAVKKEGKEELEKAAGFIEPPRLFAPGRLLYLARSPDGDTPHFSLLDGVPREQRFQRIVLRSSIIDDHDRGTYIAAMKQVLGDGARAADS